MTDLEIFHSIQASDSRENKSIEELFTVYSPKVKAISNRFKLPEDSYKDITQDALIEIVFRIKSGKFELRSDNAMQRFILRYAKNKCLSMSRDQQRKSNCLPYNLSEDDNEQISIKEEELLNKVFHEAKETSPRGLEIMQRRFLNGQSYEQISQDMNYKKSSSSAKNQLYRTLNSIRNSVDLSDYMDN